MDKQLKIRGMSNPFGRDLLPLDLDIDTAWLQQEMAATGKTAGECIADHLGAALARDLKRAAEINKEYSGLRPLRIKPAAIR
jgi:hypothetical protein